MAGRWVWMNGRRIYFPPFANQRFTGPPFWACTFTSMLNAANVGFLGEVDRVLNEQGTSAGHQITQLAKRSGDPDIFDGSTSRAMVAAMAARYHVAIALRRTSPELGSRRLKRGKALVAGVYYGKLPKHFRRWSPSFKVGHRVVCIGWRDGKGDPLDGHTKILDPLAIYGPEYTGEWIRWSAVTAAYWSTEQVWIAPGEFLPAAELDVQPSFSPPRTFHIAAGSTISAFMPQATSTARQRTFNVDRTGFFDAVVKISQPPGANPLRPTGRFIRIVAGPLAGMFVRPNSVGLTASIKPDGAEPNLAPDRRGTATQVVDDDDVADEVWVPASSGEDQKPRRTAAPSELDPIDSDPADDDETDDDDDV